MPRLFENPRVSVIWPQENRSCANRPSVISKPVTIPQEVEYHFGGNAAAAPACIFQVHYGASDFLDLSSSPARMGIAMQSKASADICLVCLIENWYGDSSALLATGVNAGFAR